MGMGITDGGDNDAITAIVMVGMMVMRIVMMEIDDCAAE